MTAETIIEKLKEDGIKGYNFGYLEDDDVYGFGRCKLVGEEGGYEGGGEYVERVVYFEDHNVYIRLTGTYYSYHGTDWNDDYTQVVPKEKTIIVYEEI